MTKQIPLNKGYFVLVDDEDYDYLMQWKWGSYAPQFYAKRYSYPEKKTIWMHREVMGNPSNFQIDHVNGDVLDNRKENLRICNATQNQGNRRKTKIKTSQYKGVSWNKRDKRWQASIRGGKSTNLGYFTSEISAARAYNKAAIDRFGEFALINEGI